jgi:putative ABC transport system substrate-binding protein
VQLRLAEAASAEELARAVAEASEGAGALMVLSDVMFFSRRRQIVELVGRHRIPALYPDREFVDVGGLMFYGASLVEMYRRAATYVDRIAKGARPADLPVEQPTRLELVLNARTGRMLGLTFPQSLVLRADEVIQ